MFEFEVEWCDSEEMLVNRGLVAGANFPSAMRRVLEYFGEKNVTKCHLAWLNDSEGVLMYKDETPMGAIKSMMAETF